MFFGDSVLFVLLVSVFGDSQNTIEVLSIELVLSFKCFKISLKCNYCSRRPASHNVLLFLRKIELKACLMFLDLESS